MRQIRVYTKNKLRTIAGYIIFVAPRKWFRVCWITSIAGCANALGVVFAPGVPFLFLRFENPGRKTPLVASAKPSLKRRLSGSCFRFGFGSVRASFSDKKPGRKPKTYASYCPRRPRENGSLRFRFVRPPRFRWSSSRFRFPLGGFRKAGNPPSLSGNRSKALIVSCGFLSLRKLAPSAVSLRRLGRALLFFSGSRLPMCSPTGRTLYRRVGHSPTLEKNRRAVAAAPFFFRAFA